MAQPVAPKSLAKREPAVLGGAIITILTGILVAAPDLGIPIPATVSKILAGIVILAGSMGIRSKVKPA